MVGPFLFLLPMTKIKNDKQTFSSPNIEKIYLYFFNLSIQ